MERIICPNCNSVKVKQVDDDEYICITCSNAGSKADFTRRIKEKDYRKLEEKFCDDKNLYLSIIDDYKKISDALSQEQLRLINRKLLVLYRQLNA